MTNQAQAAGRTMPSSKSASLAAAPLPNAWRAVAARGAVELRMFFRDQQTVCFIVAMPALLLVLLASIFGGHDAAKGSGVTIGQLYTAGLIAGGIAGTSFTYLGITIAQERANGTLKWLSATPMPRTAYFAGNARAMIAGGTDGLVKLVFRASDKTLLGAHIFGEEATELIHVAQAVLHRGGTIDEFIDTTFNFPTRADAYKYAAYDGLQRLRARA